MKRVQHYLYYLILFVATVVIYYGSLNHDFTHLDDYVQVVQNPAIRNLSFQSVKTIFSSATVGMYQPLTSFINAVVYSLSGADSFYYHLTSFIFHFFNSCLVFIFLKRFFQKEMLCFFLSLIFALHPMQVESVAWVSALSTLTYTFFSLICVLLYFKTLTQKSNLQYWLAFICFILACLAKSAAVILPLILIIADIYFLGWRNIKWINKIPFFIVSIFFGLITIHFRETAGHLSDLSVNFSTLDRFFLVCYSVLFYPLTFLFPFQLSAFYPYPELVQGRLPVLYYASPFLLAGITYVLFRFRKSTRLISGVLFFLSGIILVLQIIPVGNQIATDRYIYLPSIGLLIVLGYFLKKITHSTYFNFFFIIPVLFAVLSFQRTKIWESDEKLWTSVIEVYPNVSQAYNNLGSFALKKNEPQKAFHYFNKAIELQPRYADAYSNRGNLYAQSGNSEKAIQDYSKAIQLKEHADAYFNRANEFSKLGDINSALSDYTASLKINKSADTYTNRAFAYLKANNSQAALNDLDAATEIDNTFDRAYFLKGLVFKQNGNMNQACSNFKKAAELGNKNAGMAYQQQCSSQ